MASLLKQQLPLGRRMPMATPVKPVMPKVAARVAAIPARMAGPKVSSSNFPGCQRSPSSH